MSSKHGVIQKEVTGDQQSSLSLNSGLTVAALLVTAVGIVIQIVGTTVGCASSSDSFWAAR